MERPTKQDNKRMEADNKRMEADNKRTPKQDNKKNEKERRKRQRRFLSMPPQRHGVKPIIVEWRCVWVRRPNFIHTLDTLPEHVEPPDLVHTWFPIKEVEHGKHKGCRGILVPQFIARKEDSWIEGDMFPVEGKAKGGYSENLKVVQKRKKMEIIPGFAASVAQVRNKWYLLPGIPGMVFLPGQ